MLRIAEAALRICLIPVLEASFRVLFGLRLERTRFLPRGGPVMLVANHQGYLDPLFLQLATPRAVRYLMTSDFYDLPFARPFFRVVGAIRVSEGRAKRDSFRTALDTLRRGEPVGLFPEGRLSLDGRFTEVMPGVAFLAAKSGAPVVPVRIRGSIRVMPKGRWRPRQANVTLRFGPPMHFTDPRDRTVSARILAAWEAL